MESSNENIDGSFSNDDQLPLSNSSIKFLSETGKWTKFLSILGFIFIAMIVIMALFAGQIMSSQAFGNEELPVSGFLFGLIYFIIGAIYFFPIYYLFKFSSNIGNALRSKNSVQLDSAFENLKSHYKFVGIMAIIGLGLYGMIFIGMLMFGLALGT